MSSSSSSSSSSMLSPNFTTIAATCKDDTPEWKKEKNRQSAIARELGHVRCAIKNCTRIAFGRLPTAEKSKKEEMGRKEKNLPISKDESSICTVPLIYLTRPTTITALKSISVSDNNANNSGDIKSKGATKCIAPIVVDRRMVNQLIETTSAASSYTMAKKQSHDEWPEEEELPSAAGGGGAKGGRVVVGAPQNQPSRSKKRNKKR